ncbi:class I SAM-dependent methyltransferase [Roseomonas sp. CAU 1739]|uniref:class I SAM-dependent methyltransferase n=1 Tax=Roseomonas sp. CAU 1739 TaxID=3140364 RepID=UPI00325A6AF1
MTPGICPITGEPAELVQEVSSALLRGLWRRAFKVDPAPPPQGRIGIYRAPCGLVFFAPAVEGDAAFYESLYRRLDAGGRVRAAGGDRAEYPHAAARIRPGDAVLEVGAGAGAFASFIPEARYVGLDPNPGAYAAAAGVRAQSLADHAATHEATYAVACAFQVIEHVAEPLTLARDMVRCLKPGGMLMLGAPTWPSAMTAIPDFVFNAPPHHLSWWRDTAMTALADRLGLVVVEVRPLAPVAAQPLIHWMGRLSPLKTRPEGPWFAPRRSWYAALGLSYLLGRAASALLPLPRNAAPMFVLLIARKP